MQSESPRLAVRRLTLCTLLAVTGFGCAEPLGPGSIAGTYALARVSGAPLPVYVPTHTSSQAYLIADTFALDHRGHGTRVSVIDYWSLTGTFDSRVTTSEAVRVQRRGSQLYLAMAVWCSDHTSTDCFSEPDQLLTPVRGRLYLQLTSGVGEYRPLEQAP